MNLLAGGVWVVYLILLPNPRLYRLVLPAVLVRQSPRQKDIKAHPGGTWLGEFARLRAGFGRTGSNRVAVADGGEVSVVLSKPGSERLVRDRKRQQYYRYDSSSDGDSDNNSC